MEGQEHEYLLLLMSSNCGINAMNEFYGLGHDSNQHLAAARSGIGNQIPNALPLHQGTPCQKSPSNYVDFLAESSTFLENATGADMLDCITSPMGGTTMQSGCGSSEIQRELLFNNVGTVCGYKPLGPFPDMDASVVKFWNPHNQVESVNNFMSFQPQMLSQNYTSGRQEPHADNCTVPQPHPRETVAPSFLLSKPRPRAARQRASASDRYRRLRITERVRALQELLPHSVKSNETAVMDEVNDYVKFLQSQVKELSRSRLGGQPTSTPFVFLEGHGHFILNEQTANESLEEAMGKLLKMNPSGAIQLLESRGLYMMEDARLFG